MSHLNKIAIIFLLLFLGSMTLLSAQTGQKKFDVQSGMILYTISGGGKLTEDVNLTIQGKGKLCFKDWGVVALMEENFEEITSGALQNIETIQRCEKLEDRLRYEVDFKTKKIFKRKMPKGNFQEYITKNLVKTGQEEIAGYTCDIWEGVGVEFSKILMSIGKDMQKQFSVSEIEEDNFTPEQKRVWLDKIGQNIFEKQKLFLPQFLLSMKKARVCLAQADNWIEANSCVENVIQLKAQLTKDRENNIEQWKGKEKDKVLDDFDENISLLESRMQCIRGAQNITDLSSCMK